MGHGCKCFTAFMKAQREELRQEIDIDKWILSEKAGRDVGWTAAERDYLEKHFAVFAKKFRKKYCGERCQPPLDCKGEGLAE